MATYTDDWECVADRLPCTIDLEPAVNSRSMWRETVKASDFHLLNEHKCSSQLWIQAHLILCFWHYFESYFVGGVLRGESQEADGNRASRKLVEVGCSENMSWHGVCLFSLGGRKAGIDRKKRDKEHIRWKREVTSEDGWVGVVIRPIWLAGWQPWSISCGTE